MNTRFARLTLIVAAAAGLLAAQVVYHRSKGTSPSGINGTSQDVGLTTGTSITVTWTTPQPSSSQVAYGLTPAYGSTTTTDQTLVTSHSVTVAGLTPCTSYHFQARSETAGIWAYGADDAVFQTSCFAVYGVSDCDGYAPLPSIHVNSVGDISSIRTNAVNDVWRAAHALPTRQPDTVTLNIGSYPFLDTTGWSNLSNIDKLGINVTGGFYGEAILVKPVTSNNRLAIVHQGHCLSSGLANNLNDIGVGPMIQSLIGDGFYVLGFMMVGCGNNTPAAPGGDSGLYHNTFNSLESPTFSPMQPFLEPIAVALNYTAANYSFANVSMMGISGGGWESTIYPALDPRVTKSFPVSGSYPHAIRYPGCSSPVFPEGDYEQGDQIFGAGIPLNFYLNVMSYEDAYIMASSQGRRQIQMVRTNDPCCFGGLRYHYYDTTINSISTGLGGLGFSVFNDTTSTVHEISTAQRAAILSALGY